MNKNVNHLSVLKLNTILFFFTAFFLFSCKKEMRTEAEIIQDTKTEKLKQLGAELLSLAKNKSFTAIVFTECKKQKYGDYNVRIEELVNQENVISIISHKSKTSILKLVADLKMMGLRHPILFYPSVETKEKERLNNARLSTENEEFVLVVDERELDADGNPIGFLNDTYPGYVFNTGGQLDYYQQITEEFAWNNDVWVIGDEEECSPGNMVAAFNDDENLNVASSMLDIRTPGREEWGGIIQVTNMGEIETWVRGKFEFAFTVLNSSGGTILGPRHEFGKLRREHFRDQKWVNFNKFIGNWNISNFGNYMFEHWLEEDNGGSYNLTVSFPPPAGTSGPTLTLNIPARNGDEILGGHTIQFTDDDATIYPISYANIKRKTKN